MGNLGSVQNIIKKIGHKAIVTSDKDAILAATKIILPGVGHFQKAMSNLKELDLIEIIQQKALIEKTPILGICLGMQLLTNYSEEGNVEGLKLIDATIKKFEFESGSQLKIPHMGWNYTIPMTNNIMTSNLNSTSKFYFVHSYHAVCHQPKNILFETNYGYNFASGIYHENIYGVQFHPEKSHKFGMQLIKNFIEL
jgi:glutamine amidotransferase